MSVALAILAGGRGERLGGRIKPLLRRPDGRTLLEHLILTLAPLADETLLIAPPTLGALFLGPLIPDPGRGPGLALAAAAHATDRDLLLLAAGDLVAPSAELAAVLLAHAGVGAAAPSLDGVLQPAFAVYATKAVRAIDPPLESLRGYLARMDPFVLDAHAHAAALEDVDTEEDVARHRLSMDGVPTWAHLAGNST